MKNLKTDFIGIKVTPEMKKILREMSIKDGRSLSSYIIHTITQITVNKG